MVWVCLVCVARRLRTGVRRSFVPVCLSAGLACVISVRVVWGSDSCSGFGSAFAVRVAVPLGWSCAARHRARRVGSGLGWPRGNILFHVVASTENFLMANIVYVRVIGTG